MSTDLTTASDAALALGVARWHPEYLAEVYRRHAGAVFGVAKRLLFDPVLAEEVTQEVFTSLWQRPERFDPARGSLRAFLLALAHGRAVDMLRSETSRKAREQGARSLAGAAYDVEQEVLDLVASERLREALERLPADERSAIELAYYGGHTYREVAAIQQQPEGTVKSRIRAGLRRLAQDLAQLAQGTK